MNYKNNGYCDCCSEYTRVRIDKMQGVVCKNCDEPVMKLKPKKQKRVYDDSDSFELYPRHRKAI